MTMSMTWRCRALSALARTDNVGPMLDRAEIERAVALQETGYQLLRWLETAMDRGFIAPETAHRYASMEESARAWLNEHYLNLPPAARPPRGEIAAFSRFFSTYLTSTFDLEDNPGQRLYSPDAHCFCPCCSWMVKVARLRPKKVSSRDRKQAESMKRKLVAQLGCALSPPATDARVTEVVGDPALREPIALCTYAADLLRRMQGEAVGAASLALWRAFAWTPQGSPKKGFVLSAEGIMAAQRLLLEMLAGCRGVS